MPVLFGLAIGWQQPGRTQALALPLALVYWVSLCVASWIMVSVICFALHRLHAQQRRRLPELLVNVIGWFVSVPVVYMINTTVVGIFAAISPEFSLSPNRPLFWPDRFFSGLLIDGLPGLLLWATTVTLFRQRGIPLFGLPRSPSAGDDSQQERIPRDELPDFIEKLPAHLRGAPIAVKAERHHTYVYTEHGCARIYLSFGDALAELRQCPGVQVHRSWWVRIAAISRTRSDLKTNRLYLRNGLEVPLSRTHKAAVQTALFG